VPSFRNKYQLALATAIILLLLNQVYIQYAISKKYHDAELINIAGRQRMLSQKISLAYHRYLFTKDVEIDVIEKTFNQLELIQNALMNGNNILGIRKIENKEIHDELKALAPFFSSNRNYIKALKNQHAVDFALISNTNDAFLIKMDVIVNNLQKEAYQKLIFIVIIEVVLFFLTIIIYVVEFRYIFIPIINQIRKKTDELVVKNERLKKIGWSQNHEVRRHTANILGILQLFKSRENIASKEQLMQYLAEEIEKLDMVTRDIINEVHEVETVS